MEALPILTLPANTRGGSTATNTDSYVSDKQYRIKMVEGPYALNDDGTAKDPVAFREALRSDPEKMEALDAEPDVKEIILGDDIHAFQELIKLEYHAEKKRLEKQQKTLAERTIDAQRASAPVPRDTVQLYAQLRESGLQYGPAFRLLRNVHTPDI